MSFEVHARVEYTGYFYAPLSLTVKHNMMACLDTADISSDFLTCSAKLWGAGKLYKFSCESNQVLFYLMPAPIFLSVAPNFSKVFLRFLGEPVF